MLRPDANVPPDRWRSVLALNSHRAPQYGSASDLNAAIRRGADLRILTEFRHNEHIDTSSDNQELIREVCDFQIAYQIEDRWVAGIMGLRQPVSLPDGFGPRPSMSFFLYNQDGEQGIARPYLDGLETANTLGPTSPPAHPLMQRYHQHDLWDAATNAPSHNFVYDFDVFEYFVRDDWREVLTHDEEGIVQSGSVDTLGECFRNGCQVKVAIRNLCEDFATDSGDLLDHEVLIQAGSCYYYTERRLFIAATNPLVRIRPAIPLQYQSRGWDFGWSVARTDGKLVFRAVDPYSLTFRDQDKRCAMRWFVR